MPTDVPATDPIAAESVPAADETAVSFADLGLPAELVDELRTQGILTPFPVQIAAIPDALAGRDLLGRGRTGSGKTLAFGLPLLVRTAAASAGARAVPRKPHAVILAPTRELAMQVNDALRPYARALNLWVAPIVGGAPYERQYRDMDRGAHVVIATPGRLSDLVERSAVDLTDVKIFVLDEADQMADTGFLPAVCELLDFTEPGGQRMLFSATLDNRVQEVVDRYLKDPVEHASDPASASVPDMTHHIIKVAPRDKARIVNEIASRKGRTVMFTRSRAGAENVAIRLAELGLRVEALHGGMTQGARNRALEDFKSGFTPVLVATDVAARGIHVDDISMVLHVDPAADHKDYLHRAGRTARAGNAGTVVTLVLPHQVNQVKRLMREAGLGSVQALAMTPGSGELVDATGSREPREAAAEAVELAAAKAVADKASWDARRQSGRSDRGGYSGARRSYGDNRGRSFGDRGAERKPWDRGDRPARPASGDRPTRSYGDRDSRSYGDRPARSYGDRDNRSYGDRPARPAGTDSRSYGERPARSYGNDRPARTFAGRDDRPANRHGERPVSTERRPSNARTFSDRDGRTYTERAPRGDS